MKKFRELQKLEDILDNFPLARVEVLTKVAAGRRGELPVYGLTIGPSNPQLPTFGLFAGVHGLEKIGTHLAIHFLETLRFQLQWDEGLRQRFQQMRLVAIPLINPGGMARSQRSNPRGVDLMRNAPVEAEGGTTFLVSGHRYGQWLPWYRGQNESKMEPESQALVDFVKREMFEAPVSFALDVHSGFGMVDRLWFPYAKTRQPMPRLKQALELKDLLDQSFPAHIYQVEPQSNSYTTHGDLWDYLLDLHWEAFGEKKMFIPWTLEMGSWMWVRKNPKQALSSMGLFNPLLPHRYERIMRRHWFLIDFFCRATLNKQQWVAAA